MKKTTLAISVIAMVTSNLFAVTDTTPTPTPTPKSPLTVNSSNWTMGGKVFRGKFPIGDPLASTKEHGGDLTPLEAYSDGMGVKIIATTSAPGETINNSAYNDLVFKYGQAAKASGLSLADQVLTGTNKVIPSVKDIRMANQLIKNEIIAKNASSNRIDIAIKCPVSESLTLDELKDMIHSGKDVTHVCISGVTNFVDLFRNNTTFNQDISRWDTSHVTNMMSMFYGATSFNQPIGNWDVSSVKTMTNMFQDATNFNQPLNNWDVSGVTDTNYMFFDAYKFHQPLNNWDTSSLQTVNYMFYHAEHFSSDLSMWNVSKVTNFAYFSKYSEMDFSDQPHFAQIH